MNSSKRMNKQDVTVKSKITGSIWAPSVTKPVRFEKNITVKLL